MILIADTVHESLFSLLDSIGLDYHYRPEISRATLFETISGYEGLVIRSKAYLDLSFFSRANQLRWVARAGAGLDLLDIPAAEQRGISVFAANEGNKDAVGEHLVGMLLCLFNNLHIADNQVRNGLWLREENRGIELKNRTVGILGYGNNGSAFAEKLSGFGVNILAHDKHKTDHPFAASMEQIFAEADVFSLHVPLTSETRGLFNKRFISNFKKPFFFLNASRGEIAVLNDLLDSLISGQISGACLDVLENEKIEQLTDNEQEVFEGLKKQNVLFSPHIAGWTHESYARINEVMFEKIKAFYGK